MLESAIEKKVTAKAQKAGWISYKWCSTSQRGVPDRLFFKKGVLKIIEFKTWGKKPTELQDYIHSKLRSNGFEVHIVDSVENGLKILNVT